MHATLMHGCQVHTRPHGMIKTVCGKTAIKRSMQEARVCSNRLYAVSIWIFSMRQYLEASHCDSEEEAVCTPATYLDETALRWYERGVENRLAGFPGGPNPVTFEGFADPMREQFQSQAIIERARDRLQQLTQPRALHDCVASFRELRLRIPDNAIEADSVNWFLLGLTDGAVKYQVYEKTPVNLKEAIVWAERVTMLRSLFRQRHPSKWGGF